MLFHTRIISFGLAFLLSAVILPHADAAEIIIQRESPAVTQKKTASPFKHIKKPVIAKKDQKQERRRPKDPIKVTGQTGHCIECHREETPGIFEEWVNSTHARVGVGCQDCHSTEKSDAHGFFHAGRFYITPIVTPFECAKCHKDQMRDYTTSNHARSLELLREMKEDDPRYPVVAQYKDNDFQQCSGCHGSVVTVGEDHRPDPSSWPNSGAGRLNPNRSHGTCASCHMGHRFSVAAARQPETCLRCHDGENYPEGDIYQHSAHGTVYETQADKDNLDRPGYFFNGTQMVSPTCAFCHMNGSGHGLLTRHNPAWRLPRDLTNPQTPLLTRAENFRSYMQAVCNQCHAPSVIDRFFDNADKELENYQVNIFLPKLGEYQEKLKISEGENRTQLLDEYSHFLAEGKRYRMNLYMGSHGRTQR